MSASDLCGSLGDAFPTVATQVWQMAESCQQAGLFTWSSRTVQLDLSDFFVLSL